MPTGARPRKLTAEDGHLSAVEGETKKLRELAMSRGRVCLDPTLRPSFVRDLDNETSGKERKKERKKDGQGKGATGAKGEPEQTAGFLGTIANSAAAMLGIGNANGASASK